MANILDGIGLILKINGVEINKNKILGRPIIHRSNVYRGQLSPAECNFTLSNDYAYIYSSLDVFEGQKIEVWLNTDITGSVVSTKVFDGYALKPTMNSDNEIVFKAKDRFWTWRSTKLGDEVFYNYSFDTLLVHLLETYGGLTSTDYSLEATGLNLSFFSIAKKDKLLDILQLMAKSVNGQLYFDNEGKLQFRAGFLSTFSTTEVMAVTASDILPDFSVQKLEDVDEVIVKSKYKTIAEEKDYIFTWSGKVPDGGIPNPKDEEENTVSNLWKANFNSCAIEVDLYADVEFEADSGVTLDEAKYNSNFNTGVLKYPDFMYLQVNNSSGGELEVTKLGIKGKAVIEGDLEYTYTDVVTINKSVTLNNNLVATQVWAGKLAQFYYEENHGKYEIEVTSNTFLTACGLNVVDKIGIVLPEDPFLLGLSNRCWITDLDIDCDEGEVKITAQTDRSSAFVYIPGPAIVGPGPIRWGRFVYTPILTNESHSVLCDSNGDPTTGELGDTGKAKTDIKVWRDATELVATNSTPTIGEFKITIDSTSGGTGIKLDADTIYLDSFDVGSNSALINVSINIENKITVAKQMSLTKTIAGASASIQVQYSIDGSTNWHETFTTGDIYMRQSINNGSSWSDAIRIVGEDGAAGEDGEDGNYTQYIFRKSATKPDTPSGVNPSYWFDYPPQYATEENGVFLSFGEPGDLTGYSIFSVDLTTFFSIGDIVLLESANTSKLYIRNVVDVNPIELTIDSELPESSIYGAFPTTAGEKLFMSKAVFLSEELQEDWSEPVQINGDSAKIITITASSQMIVYGNDGTNPTPDVSTDIILTATPENCTPTTYKFSLSTNGETFNQVQNTSSPIFTHEISATYSGNYYTYKIEALDAGAGVLATDIITIYEVKDGQVGDGEKPSAPTNLTLVSFADEKGTKIKINFIKSASNDIRHYLMKYYTAADVDDTGINGYLANASDLTLSRGSGDYFTSHFSNGDLILLVSQTTGAAYLRTANSVTSTVVTLNEAVQEGAGTYDIFKLNNEIKEIPVASNNFIVDSEPNTTYYFTIIAYDWDNLYSDGLAGNITTQNSVPAAPDSATAIPGKSAIGVSWIPVHDPNFSYYQVDRKYKTGEFGVYGEYTTLFAKVEGTHIIDENLIKSGDEINYNIYYKYKITSIGIGGAESSFVETAESGVCPGKTSMYDLLSALIFQAAQYIQVGSLLKLGYNVLPSGKNGIYIYGDGNLQINISDYMEDIGVDGVLTSNTDLTVYNSSGNFSNHFEVGDLVLLGAKTDLWTEIPIKGDTTSTSDITIERNSGYNGNFADYFQVGDSIFLDFTDIGGSTYERTITAIDENVITINAGCSSYGSGIKIYKKINSGDKILRAVTAVGSAIISIDRPIEVRTGYPLTLDVFKVTADKGLFFDGENGDMKVMGDLFVAAKNNKIRFVDSGINLTDENAPFNYSNLLLNRIKFSRKQIYRKLRQELTFDFVRCLASNFDDYQVGSFFRQNVKSTKNPSNNYDITEQQLRIGNLMVDSETTLPSSGRDILCNQVDRGIAIEKRFTYLTSGVLDYIYSGEISILENDSGGAFVKTLRYGRNMISYYSSKPANPPKDMPCVIYHNSKYWLIWQAAGGEFFQREVFKKTWSEVGG